MYGMESFGIIEMLAWYAVGFSTTILTLQTMSKLNLRRRKEIRTVPPGPTYAVLRQG